MVKCPICRQDNVPASAQICPHCGAPLALLLKNALAPDTMLAGRRYRIDHVLGTGGFGITYQAEHVFLKEVVAIKEFYPDGAVTRDSSTGNVVLLPFTLQAEYDHDLQSFIDEARILAKIKHPNVVRVRDLFEEHGTTYLVMDFVAAKTLLEEIKTKPNHTLTPDEVRQIVDQLVSGLEAVHNAGIYHLDIKPDNVLLTSSGQAILIDFGAAKEAVRVTTSHPRLGSPGYAPPELWKKDPVGPFSDIFELGMMLHEMLTGTLPPPSSNRHADHVFDPTGVPEPWRTLIRSAIQMDPSKRPSDIRKWWQSIAPTQQQLVPAQVAVPTPPVPHVPIPTPQLAPSIAAGPMKSSPMRVILVIAAVVIVAAGLYFYLNKGSSTPPDIGSRAQSTATLTTTALVAQEPSVTTIAIIGNVQSPTAVPIITEVPPATLVVPPVPTAELASTTALTVPSAVLPLPTSTPLLMPSKLEVADAHASSISESGRDYGPMNVINNSATGPWDSADGDVQGSWIELLMPQVRIVVEIHLRIFTDGSAARIEDATLLFSDNSSQNIHLKNFDGWQTVEITPVATSKVRLRVDSFYPGDTVLSVFTKSICWVGNNSEICRQTKLISEDKLSRDYTKKAIQETSV